MTDLFKAKEKAVTIKTPDAKHIKENFLGKLPDSFPGMISNSSNPLASLSYRPKKFNFEGRQSGEETILFLRKHPITNIQWIVVAILLLMGPYILEPLGLDKILPQGFFFVIMLFWYLVTMAYVIENFLNWFFNINIVTDERIIDIDFYNMIYKEVTVATLDKVQDVRYKVAGVFGMVFNFGDVFIQTASEVPTIEFVSVPNPDKIVEVLQKLDEQEDTEAIEGRVK